MLDYWQAETGPGVWLQGLWVPKQVLDHLRVGWLLKQLWLQGPGRPEACVGLLAGKAQAQQVPG